MNPHSAALAVVLGLMVRLAIPILATALVVAFLRRLDSRWQSEARYAPLKVEKPHCWKIRGCAPAEREVCPAPQSPVPCWQVFRLPNGYLREKCLTCDVLAKAPLPSHA